MSIKVLFWPLIAAFRALYALEVWIVCLMSFGMVNCSINRDAIRVVGRYIIFGTTE